MGELFAFLSACSFGTSNVAIRLGMRMSRDNGTFISTFVNMVTFLAVVLFLHFRSLLPELTLLGFTIFVVAGLLTTFGGRSLHYEAIRVLGPSRATSLRCTSPVFTVFLALLFLAEQFSLLQFLGVAGVITGVWVLSQEAARQTNLAVVIAPAAGGNVLLPNAKVELPPRSPWVGILYGLGAAASFGIGHFMRKLAVIEVPSPFWGMVIGTTAAWLAMVLQAAVKGELMELWHSSFNCQQPPWFFLLAGILSAAGQMFSYLSIYYTAVSIAVVFASTEPLATLAIGRLLLGTEEAFNWRLAAGAAVTFVGIALILI